MARALAVVQRAMAGRRRLGWAAVAAYAGLLAYLSLRPVGDSSLDRAIASVGRAYLHLPAYAVLAAALGAVGASASAVRRAVVGLLVATAYGWLLELAQIPAPTRFFNVLGLALDAAGAAAGAAAIFLVCTLRGRRRRKRLPPTARHGAGEP